MPLLASRSEEGRDMIFKTSVQGHVASPVDYSISVRLQAVRGVVETWTTIWGVKEDEQ